MIPSRCQPCFACIVACLGCALLAAACGGSSGSGSAPPPPAPAPPAGSLGLDARPANLTCLAPARGSAQEVEIAVERVFASLTFAQPLALLQAPDDDTRWFVLEKEGRVRVFANDPNVSAFEADFITLAVNAASEGGLLGMAFHPEFASNGRVFLSWTEGTPMQSVVASFESLDGGRTLDPGTRVEILRVRQEQNNHNGGHLAFGPDGHLYFGLGDGGGSGDPLGRAQDTSNLLGAILRIDVNGGTPYAIPPDNPFAGNPVCPADHSATWSCPEIYAWGLRNPWRWSFDAETGTLWAADVGQNAREEINHVERGGNYGWNCREGTQPFAGAGASCATATDLIDPIHDYPHSLGRSVTGGYVYRGASIPALAGQYVFGDFVSGRIWRLLEDGATFRAEELASTSLSIASFGLDSDGELYVVSLGGTLHRLAATDADDSEPPPALLSATGCVDGGDATRPAAGLIPYGVSAPAWFDGAVRDRWLAIPDGTTVAVDAEDRFVFPQGSVLVEHFRLDGELIETRLLMHHPGGEWAGYSYEWNEGGTDAALVEGGKVVSIAGREWLYPSTSQCLSCHTAAAGFTLALETAQLNHALLYPATGRTAHQLATLDGIGLFASPIGDPAVLPSLPDPQGEPAPLDARARAYLHTNCAHCHRPDAPAAAALDLRHTTLLEQTGACDTVPQRGDLGIANARIIAPGDSARSVLLARMERRDVHGMPPLGSSVPDAAGLELVADWIDALGGCL